MKHIDTTIPVEKLSGIDTRQPQKPEVANLVENMVKEADGSWSTRVGWEKYFTGDTQYGPFTGGTFVGSIFYWRRKGNRAPILMYEAGGYIYALTHNPPSRTVVKSGLSRPDRTEHGMQYAVMGDRVYMCNGREDPSVYDSRICRPLGWSVRPSPPNVYLVDDQGLTFIGPSPTGHTHSFLTQAMTPDVTAVGLGDDTENHKNAYRYKVAFLSDTGAMSPLSEASHAVKWITSAGEWRFMVTLRDLPTGPEGTIARVIYRTSNFEQTFDQQTYYQVGVVKDNISTIYHDTVSDYEVSTPYLDNTILNPFTRPHLITSYAGRMWYVDKDQPFTVFCSEPYMPESFTIDGSFATNSSTGGQIVALVPWQEYLLIFRDNAIDCIVTTDAGTNFKVVPITVGIGLPGMGTIQAVPGFGVVFLTSRAIYLLNENTDTGKIQIKDISGGLHEQLMQINTGRMASTSSAVSSKWAEYHVYFDANNEERRGLVLSLRDFSWSVRTGFPVGPCTTDLRGNIIFGHRYGCFTPAGVYAHKLPSGLFVISRRRINGYTSSGGFQDWITVDNQPCVSVYESAWIYAPDRLYNKAFRYLYLYMRSTGSQALSVQTAVNGRRSTTPGGPNIKAQWVTGDEQPVWNQIQYDAPDAIWQGDDLIEVRFDIDAVGNKFKFRIETQNDMVLIGYAVSITDIPGQLMPGRRV